MCYYLILNLFKHICHKNSDFRSATEREKVEEKSDTEKLMEYITELR